MENDIDKKLKIVIKGLGKKKKASKGRFARISIGKYVGKRGSYKFYKVKGRMVAIRYRKLPKGGDEVEQPEGDYYVDILPFANADSSEEPEFHPVEDESSSDEYIPPQERKFEEGDSELAPEDPKFIEEVKALEIIPQKKKRVPSAKQAKWMAYVAKIAALPEMKNKSRAFVMQEASRKRKYCPESYTDVVPV